MRYLYIFSLLSLMACNNSPKESSQAKEEIAVQSNTSTEQGIRYEGAIQIGTKELVDTTIVLGNNNEYTKTVIFPDHEPTIHKGKFEWNEADKTIALIGENGTKEYYRVDAQVLIYLADPNKKLTAEEEAMVTLHQK